MLKNYIKIAFRNLFRHRLFSIVNILCLSIGITFFMIIGVYVLQQHRVNSDLKNVANQYYLKSNWKTRGMGMDITTIGPLAKTMRREYPGLVTNFYRFNPITNVISAGDRHFKEDVAICDTTLVSMFGFPLLYGDKEHAFPNSSSALITETLAMKLFEKKDVVGQTIHLHTLQGPDQVYIVSGVLKDMPYNSIQGSFTDKGSFGAYVPFAGNQYYPSDAGDESWQMWNMAGLIELRKGIRPADLDKAFTLVLKKYADKTVQDNLRVELAPLSSYFIQENNGAIGRLITALAMVAFFILLLAVINFININIGTSAYRLKEIGLRKVFGGERMQLISQFITESFAMAAVAGVVSLGLYEILRPLFNRLLEWQLDPLVQFGWKNLGFFILLVMAVGLLAGIYPAFVLSSSKIVHSVKGKLDTALGGLMIRKALLVVQFSLAIVVFICALTVAKQIDYAFHKDLGFNRDHLLVVTPFPKQWDSAGVARIERVKEDLKQLPVVKDGSLSFDLIEVPPGTLGMTPEGSEDKKPLVIPTLTADAEFARTYGLQVLEGNFFNDGKGSLIRDQVVLNESAVRALGWKEGEPVIGKKIKTLAGTTITVAGVIKDFNYANLQTAISPLAIIHVADNPIYRFLTIKLTGPDMALAIEDVRAKWKSLLPNSPFEYTFMDDRFKALYRTELQLRNAAGIATALNMVVVFLGIFGVVAFTLLKRSKEMAIRKVLGADMRTIILLFLRDYAWLLLIANGIGWPLAYAFTGKWLQSFVYRAPQGPGPYVFVLVFIFLAVGLLVAVQCLKSAVESPVQRLRAE